MGDGARSRRRATTARVGTIRGDREGRSGSRIKKAKKRGQRHGGGKLPRARFMKTQVFQQMGRSLTRRSTMLGWGRSGRFPQVGTRFGLRLSLPRHRSVARPKPAPRLKGSKAVPLRPLHLPPTAKTGSAAMWEEYPVYKAARLLHVWRDRWRAYLPQSDAPTHG